jgi:hypothetical protein
MTEPQLGDLDEARQLLEQLLAAAETLAHYDDFDALDSRNAAVRELARRGVRKDALRWMARIGPTELDAITKDLDKLRRPRYHLTQRLVAIAAGAETPPP